MTNSNLLHPFFYAILLLVLIPLGANAQDILSPIDHDADQVYDRMIILSGGYDRWKDNFTIHSSIKPYSRKDLVILADYFSLSGAHSSVDYAQISNTWDQQNEFLVPDSISIGDGPYYISPSSRRYNAIGTWSTDGNTFQYPYRLSRKPLWHTFYKTPANFYEVDVPDFYLRINPVIRFEVGRESNEGVTTFVNQRGIQLRGGIGSSVFFQTSLYDNQVRYPNYVNQFTEKYGVVPGVGLYKDFNSALFDFTKGRDFLLAEAYVGVNFGKYIGMQLGHHQSFIGDGLRSLLLSDFSTPFFSLKFNTKIWKFHYQNIFAELAADNFISVSGTNSAIPKKYMAAHYLDFKPSPQVSIGLYEAVIFNRPNHQFELQYLNPIILYRTIEGSLGSPDNVLLGLNARVDLWKRFSCYGQLILDDISVSNILDGHLDWWGNKFGHQLGFKYLNVLSIDHLDVQAEWNSVRPYTYSHYDFNANYSNYKQALAHPLGANFSEVIFSVTYPFHPKWLFKSSLYLMQKGEDPDSISFGGDILQPNTLRPDDYGHHIVQGAKASIMYWSTRLQYEVSTGVFLEGTILIRRKSAILSVQNLNTSLFQVGVRYNLAYREEVF